MNKSRLRLFSGSDGDGAQPDIPAIKQVKSAPIITEVNHNATVNVSLRQVLPLLLDASLCDRSWLTDFLDDKITVSSDLFEVLEAYREYRNRAA